MPGRPAPAAPTTPWARVYGTAETLLDVYGDPVIAASAEGCDLDLDELLTGANNTLYLYAPASPSRSGSGRCSSSWSRW